MRSVGGRDRHTPDSQIIAASSRPNSDAQENSFPMDYSFARDPTKD
jgi:hypothetical protein